MFKLRKLFTIATITALISVAATSNAFAAGNNQSGSMVQGRTYVNYDASSLSQEEREQYVKDRLDYMKSMMQRQVDKGYMTQEQTDAMYRNMEKQANQYLENPDDYPYGFGGCGGMMGGRYSSSGYENSDL